MQQQAPLLTNDSGGGGLRGFVGRERAAATEAAGILVDTVGVLNSSECYFCKVQSASPQ